MAAHWLDTAVVLVLFFLFKELLGRVFTRRVNDPVRRYTISKTTSYIVGLLALILIVRIWFRAGENIGTTVGIMSAGLAIALQDPISNFAAWMFIIIRRPFTVGDRIEINGHAGDVVDIRLFMFSMLEVGNWVAADQSTGRLIHIPNGMVFKNPVANYTEGFDYIWNEIAVMVTFESDWERAHAILTEIGKEYAAENADEINRQLRQTTSKYMVYFRYLTPIVWVSVADSGVVLTLRYLCPVRKRRGSSTEIWGAILRAFAADDSVDFAYPTTRRFDNVVEGKIDARAQPLPTYKPKD